MYYFFWAMFLMYLLGNLIKPIDKLSGVVPLIATLGIVVCLLGIDLKGWLDKHQ